MRIVFTPVPGGECITTFQRRDGVVVAMPSYSRKWRVPHDLAHAVAERELSIAHGVFGSVAADTLRSLATEWAGVPAGGTLEFFWPDRLVAPAPPPRARRSAARLAPSRG